MTSSCERQDVPAQLWRVTTSDPDALCSAGMRSQRFRRHEDILVLNGWKSLNRSIGLRQLISIVRALGGDSPWRLTSSEFDLVRTVAVGFAVKQAAAELGIEWASARTTLSRALRKLGIRGCAHLPGFWHGLSGALSLSRVGDGTELLVIESRLDVQSLPVPLTSAEHDVLQAVLMGCNNQQIARQRNTSIRTVANQLATLFQKFSASSKAELASKALLLDSSFGGNRDGVNPSLRPLSESSAS
jgi:DNA-binding NarL/FixJ family response regulator